MWRVLTSRLQSLPPAQRVTVLGAVLLLLLVATFLAGPYLHALTTLVYVDTRRVLGVPNFINVVSSLAFLLVGLAGVALCAGTRPPRAAHSWRVFYAGMVLTCLGSVWYHLAPSDATILWDRLGMVVAFVGLWGAVFEESCGVPPSSALLGAALLTGVASVLWWRISGDLRVYAWVQLAPLACVVSGLLLNWFTRPMQRAMQLSLACYVLAKLAESFDARIYGLTAHLVSGHTLKHLLAAAAAVPILAAQSRAPPPPADARARVRGTSS
jgi:hypothetical protein